MAARTFPGISSSRSRQACSRLRSPVPSKMTRQAKFFMARRPAIMISIPFCQSNLLTRASRGTSLSTGKPNSASKARLFWLRVVKLLTAKLNLSAGSVAGSQDSTSMPLRIPVRWPDLFLRKSCKSQPYSGVRISFA